MKPVNFDYVRPRDIADAVRALAGSDGEGKLISGGQSLGPMLNLRLVRPRLLIDVGQLGEMKQVEDRGDAWRIGAGVTHAALEDGRHAVRIDGMIPAVARRIAYRAVRNRGTIGGSLAHADPAADWPLALYALDATVNVVGPNGRRAELLGEFMVASFTTTLGTDELVESVTVPKPSSAARWGYYKFCRKAGEFPDASAAIVVDPERQYARIVVGALDAKPRSLGRLAAEISKGGRAAASEGACSAAIREVAETLDAIDLQIHSATLVRAIDQVYPS